MIGGMNGMIMIGIEGSIETQRCLGGQERKRVAWNTQTNWYPIVHIADECVQSEKRPAAYFERVTSEGAITGSKMRRRRNRLLRRQ